MKNILLILIILVVAVFADAPKGNNMATGDVIADALTKLNNGESLTASEIEGVRIKLNDIDRVSGITGGWIQPGANYPYFEYMKVNDSDYYNPPIDYSYYSKGTVSTTAGNWENITWTSGQIITEGVVRVDSSGSAKILTFDNPQEAGKNNQLYRWSIYISVLSTPDADMWARVSFYDSSDSLISAQNFFTSETDSEFVRSMIGVLPVDTAYFQLEIKTVADESGITIDFVVEKIGRRS